MAALEVELERAGKQVTELKAQVAKQQQQHQAAASRRRCGRARRVGQRQWGGGQRLTQSRRGALLGSVNVSVEASRQMSTIHSAHTLHHKTSCSLLAAAVVDNAGAQGPGRRRRGGAGGASGHGAGGAGGGAGGGAAGAAGGGAGGAAGRGAEDAAGVTGILRLAMEVMRW